MGRNQQFVDPAARKVRLNVFDDLGIAFDESDRLSVPFVFPGIRSNGWRPSPEISWVSGGVRWEMVRSGDTRRLHVYSSS